MTFLWNLGVVGATLLALVVLLAVLHRVECRVSRYLSRRIGWRASLYPTAVLGVPLHELSHLAAARLFGHRVVGYNLFEPDPATGTLGYVRHAYRRRNLWQLTGTFFIGIAPFVVGACALVVIGASMLPSTARLDLLAGAHRMLNQPSTEPIELVSLALFALRSVEVTPWLPIQLYLAVAVAAHMAPSPRDLAGGLLGGIVLAVALAGIVTLASAGSLTALPLAMVLVPVSAFATLAVLLQIAHALLVAIVTRPAHT